MSTEINVVVDTGGLRERNRQQTQANRQAQLEKQQRDQAVRDGLITRLGREVTRRSTSPTGASALGAPSWQTSNTNRDKKQERELTAAPNGDIYFLMRPNELPTANEWLAPNRNAVLHLKQKGNYIRNIVTRTSNNTYGLGRPTYLPTGGPNGAPALEATPYKVDDNSKYNNVELYGALKSSRQKKLKEFTLQFYFKLGYTKTASFYGEPPINMIVNLSTNPGVYIEFQTLFDPGANNFPSGRYRRLNYGIGTSESTYQEYYDLFSNDGPDLSPNVWHHAAMTLKNSVSYAFLDGKLLSYSSIGRKTIDIFRDPLDSEWLFVEFGQWYGGFTYDGLPNYLHGLKFESKCLWTADFTPPPSIR